MRGLEINLIYNSFMKRAKQLYLLSEFMKAIMIVIEFIIIHITLGDRIKRLQFNVRLINI